MKCTDSTRATPHKQQASLIKTPAIMGYFSMSYISSLKSMETKGFTKKPITTGFFISPVP